MAAGRWLLVACLALHAAPARSEDRVQECIGEHVEAQLLRNQGRLAQARARLAACATPACPALVRDECAALAREVEAALPSIVPAALDARGRPTRDVTLSIDGADAPLPLDGRAVPLDPGEHHLRFRSAEGRVLEQTVVLAPAERRRPVTVDFREAAGGDAPRESRAWQNVAVASAGVAALALGSFTYFAVSGRAIESELERCKPSCPDRSEVERMRSRYRVADLSLGVALLSLGAGAYAWAQAPSPAPPRGRGSHAPPDGVATLRLAPMAAPRRLGLWASGEF